MQEHDKLSVSPESRTNISGHRDDGALSNQIWNLAHASNEMPQATQHRADSHARRHEGTPQGGGTHAGADHHPHRVEGHQDNDIPAGINRAELNRSLREMRRLWNTPLPNGEHIKGDQNSSPEAFLRGGGVTLPPLDLQMLNEVMTAKSPERK